MPDNAAAPATGTAVDTARPVNPIVQFREQLETRSNELKMALPSHITAEKFQRTVITAVQQNPDLLRVNRQSLVLACMKAAQDGLLPDGREAALVPFKRNFKEGGQWKSVEEAAYIPMVYGVRKKILQSRDAEGKPVVSALEVGVVYRKEVENQHFYYEVGKYPPLGHRPMLDLTAEDTTDDKIVGAYSIATMADGTKSYEFMRRFEIDKVQNASQTGAKVGRDGKPREPKGPWADWYPEMCKKTVLRRHAKSLPQSGDLIIDTDDDQPYGESAALTLGAAGEAEPTLITDRDGDTIDTTTGEIVDTAAENVTDTDTSDEPVKETAKAEPEQGKKQTRSKASAEGNGPASEATAQSSDEATPTENGTTTSNSGQTATTAASPSEPQRTMASEIGLDEDEQTGVTKHPAEPKAEQILGDFGKAENIIDLERLYSENEQDIAAMPDELYDTVMGGYNRNRVRLGAKRVSTQQTEPAQ